MAKLLFLVHPDMFAEGGQAHQTNSQGVQTLNSFVDQHRDTAQKESTGDSGQHHAHSQPAPPIALKLFVRQRGKAAAAVGDGRQIEAILHSPSRSQPLAFEQSMDRLFNLGALPTCCCCRCCSAETA